METNKRQYQAPALIDQGSVVTRTMATCEGDTFDGSPNHPCDRKWVPCGCGTDEEASLS